MVSSGRSILRGSRLVSVGDPKLRRALVHGRACSSPADRLLLCLPPQPQPSWVRAPPGYVEEGPGLSGAEAYPPLRARSRSPPRRAPYPPAADEPPRRLPAVRQLDVDAPPQRVPSWVPRGSSSGGGTMSRTGVVDHPPPHRAPGPRPSPPLPHAPTQHDDRLMYERRRRSFEEDGHPPFPRRPSMEDQRGFEQRPRSSVEDGMPPRGYEEGRRSSFEEDDSRGYGRRPSFEGNGSSSSRQGPPPRVRVERWCDSSHRASARHAPPGPST